MEFNVDKANALLEAAGWKKGADGIREKGGKKMKFVYQTSVNGIRQKEQAVIKQACQKAGIDLELKSVTASVFFSSDVANPDTYGKFWCDMQMYTTTMTQPDPERFMDQYRAHEISAKANKWQGRNIARWRNDEYEKVYAQAEAELDPVKRAALFIRMNDIVVGDNAIIPLVSRPRVRGANHKLMTALTGWDLDFSGLHNWYREA
jgi:peptide/nickel transport system substrate-binding protein